MPYLVFIDCPKGRCPIQIGDMLGEMNNQYPKHRAAAYYSTGCKAYVLRMYDIITGEVKDVVKAKGVTIDIRTKKSINFAAMKVRYAVIMPSFFLKVIPLANGRQLWQRDAKEGNGNTLQARFNKGASGDEEDCQDISGSI
jgi:hypothetical protein